MILRPMTTVAELSGLLPEGNGFIRTDSGLIFGGAFIHADGVNCVTVTVRKDSPTGDIIFEASSHIPIFVSAPFEAGTKLCYYLISGECGEAQLFEWVV